jgi:ABC-type bacteriocin/lantibiotic exporter with double-glycine peptidase domain
MNNDWNKYHVFLEKDGYCGVAVIQMILAKVGIEKSQENIARYVYKKWYGTPHDFMLGYLSKFFKIVNYKNNAEIKDISYHLKKENIVVVNWWDDLNGEPEGHYSIVADYNKETKMLTLVDPSNERNGIWDISSKEFVKKWYDTIDLFNHIWIDGWMLWVNPKTLLQ